MNLPYPLGTPEAESHAGNDLDDAGFDKMKELYKSQVVVPDQGLRPQFIICPIGLVGSGKTTVMKELSKHFGLVRISSDEIRLLLEKNGYNSIRTVELSFAITKEFALAGKSIGIDADCSGPNIQKAVTESSAELGMKVIWIHVAPPEEFMIMVNTERKLPRNWPFNEDALAAYYRRKPLHEYLTASFAFTFDTSKSDMPEQIKKAEMVIEELLSQ